MTAGLEERFSHAQDRNFVSSCSLFKIQFVSFKKTTKQISPAKSASIAMLQIIISDMGQFEKGRT